MSIRKKLFSGILSLVIVLGAIGELFAGAPDLTIAYAWLYNPNRQIYRYRTSSENWDGDPMRIKVAVCNIGAAQTGDVSFQIHTWGEEDGLFGFLGGDSDLEGILGSITAPGPWPTNKWRYFDIAPVCPGGVMASGLNTIQDYPSMVAIEDVHGDADETNLGNNIMEWGTGLDNMCTYPGYTDLTWRQYLTQYKGTPVGNNWTVDCEPANAVTTERVTEEKEHTNNFTNLIRKVGPQDFHGNLKFGASDNDGAQVSDFSTNFGTDGTDEGWITSQNNLEATVKVDRPSGSGDYKIVVSTKDGDSLAFDFNYSIDWMARAYVDLCGETVIALGNTAIDDNLATINAYFGYMVAAEVSAGIAAGFDAAGMLVNDGGPDDEWQWDSGGIGYWYFVGFKAGLSLQIWTGLRVNDTVNGDKDYEIARAGATLGAILGFAGGEKWCYGRADDGDMRWSSSAQQASLWGWYYSFGYNFSPTSVIKAAWHLTRIAAYKILTQQLNKLSPETKQILLAALDKCGAMGWIDFLDPNSRINQKMNGIIDDLGLDDIEKAKFWSEVNGGLPDAEDLAKIGVDTNTLTGFDDFKHLLYSVAPGDVIQAEAIQSRYDAGLTLGRVNPVSLVNPPYLYMTGDAADSHNAVIASEYIFWDSSYFGEGEETIQRPVQICAKAVPGLYNSQVVWPTMRVRVNGLEVFSQKITDLEPTVYTTLPGTFNKGLSRVEIILEDARRDGEGVETRRLDLDWFKVPENDLGAAPVITDNQAGYNTVMRSAADGVFDLNFADVNGDMSTGQYKIYSEPAKGGTLLYTGTIFSGSPRSSYSNDWPINATAFNFCQEDKFNYVSVEATDVAGNTTKKNDVFFIMKDAVYDSVNLISDPTFNFFIDGQFPAWDENYTDAGNVVSQDVDENGDTCLKIVRDGTNYWTGVSQKFPAKIGATYRLSGEAKSNMSLGSLSSQMGFWEPDLPQPNPTPDRRASSGAFPNDGSWHTFSYDWHYNYDPDKSSNANPNNSARLSLLSANPSTGVGYYRNVKLEQIVKMKPRLSVPSFAIRIQIDWDVPPDCTFDQYRIEYRKKGTAGWWVKDIAKTVGNSYNLTDYVNMEYNTEYDVRMQPLNGATLVGEPSDIQTSPPLGAPMAAPAQTLTVAKALKVMWTAPAGPAVTHYDLRYRVSGSGDSYTSVIDPPATIDGNVTSYTICDYVNMAHNTSYDVIIAACDEVGARTHFGSTVMTTSPAPEPAKLTPLAEGIKVDWEDRAVWDNRTSKFQVIWKKATSASYPPANVMEIDVSQPSECNITGLRSGVEYRVKVASYDKYTPQKRSDFISAGTCIPNKRRSGAKRQLFKDLDGGDMR